MIRIFVNNLPFYIKKDISVLEALSFLGLRVPRFCYHEALSVAGNCRICLVEVDTSPKLIASCAQPILANMQIFSNTIKVLKSRENVLESLLINHPLDCPICDQAGECDLQDQSKVFGGIYTRHIFAKRGVENKIIDPCIKTIMTRCIHCTRCVRFAAEITGQPFLGTLNRGRFTEIGGFISYFQDSSEVSGNVIDLCPVGALTAKPYAFKARPWELRSIETIDLTDGLGSNIYINLKELQIISVLPKNNSFINGQWISNKARFYIDALQRYRISTPWVKNFSKNENLLQSLKILDTLASNNIKKHLFIINEDIDFKSLALLKKLNNAYPTVFNIYNNSTFFKQSNFYSSQNNKINLLETFNSNCFILLATNIRTESAVINIKLRIKAKSKKINALNLGQRIDSFFPIKFLNITTNLILNIIEAKNLNYSKLIFSKSQPIFLIGEAFFKRININQNNIITHLNKYNQNNLIYIINKKSNSESIKALNIKSINSRAIALNNGNIYFCNLDDNLNTRNIVNNTKLNSIWLHTHGSQVATQCNYIIPTLSYFETEGIFLNLEKRPQKSIKMLENRSSNTVYSLIEIIKIIKELKKININLNLLSKSFNYMDEILKNPNLFNQLINKYNKLYVYNDQILGNYSKYPFKPIINDFYLTNSYSSYSINMNNYSNSNRLKNNILLNLLK